MSLPHLFTLWAVNGGTESSQIASKYVHLCSEKKNLVWNDFRVNYNWVFIYGLIAYQLNFLFHSSVFHISFSASQHMVNHCFSFLVIGFLFKPYSFTSVMYASIHCRGGLWFYETFRSWLYLFLPQQLPSKCSLWWINGIQQDGVHKQLNSLRFFMCSVLIMVQVLLVV